MEVSNMLIWSGSTLPQKKKKKKKTTKVNLVDSQKMDQGK